MEELAEKQGYSSPIFTSDTNKTKDVKTSRPCGVYTLGISTLKFKPFDTSERNHRTG